MKPIIIYAYIADKKNYEKMLKPGKEANKPITRKQAYNTQRDAAEAFGLRDIGTPTLRKTFGYHTYQQSHDAVTLKDIFNLSDIPITIRYIGMNHDKKTLKIIIYHLKINQTSLKQEKI